MQQISRLFNVKNTSRACNGTIEVVTIDASSPESSAVGKSYQNTNIDKCEYPKFNEKQVELIKTVAKISVLVGCTLFTTMISMTIMVIGAITDDRYIAPSMGILAASSDICVNAVCLMLQWPFAQHWYKKLCNPCNNIMIRRCANNVQQYIRQTETSTS